MVRIEKEIYKGDTWIHIDTATVKGADDALWPLIFQTGDTLRRKYSPVTKMAYDFIAPESSAVHLSSKNLAVLRERIGAVQFDEMFGYFPFDPVDVFLDGEARNDIVRELGILDVRVIAWRY